MTIQLIPVPAYGLRNLSSAGNFAAYIDRLILTQQRLWAGQP